MTDIFREKIVETLKKYSTEESSDKALYHSYEYLYPDILKNYLNKDINMLEIGVAGGYSLLCWSDLFPSSKIYGVDWKLHLAIDEIYKRQNIKLYSGSQSDPRTFEFARDIKFDIIIDDASHRQEDQMASFNILKDRLNKGGYYIIEDIYPEYIYPDEFLRNFEVRDFTKIKNRGDDKVFIYRNN